jgi:syntaxin 1B/2/3
MNDLFSSSFKKYTDLKQQAQIDDMEAGKEGMNLDRFFEDVENIKEDMKTVDLFN